MSDKTRIEWTDATWNAVTGCSKVSAGCKYCYAEREWARLSANPATRYYGRDFTHVRCHSDVLEMPLRWRRPRRIFVNSMSDLFHEVVTHEFIDDVFITMARSPQHIFQILTKRPGRMLNYLSHSEGMIRDLVKYEPAAEAMNWPLPNVWLGVSVEDQVAANERIPLLLQTPAAVRWVSAEPLLGPVDLRRYLDVDLDRGIGAPWLDWVVAGGESGPHARPMHPEWVRSLRDQCAGAGIPFLFKQWGEWAEDKQHGLATGMDGPVRAYRFEDGMLVERVGKKYAGRLLDGELHNGFPA